MVQRFCSDSDFLKCCQFSDSDSVFVKFSDSDFSFPKISDSTDSYTMFFDLANSNSGFCRLCNGDSDSDFAEFLDSDFQQETNDIRTHWSSITVTKNAIDIYSSVRTLSEPSLNAVLWDDQVPR
uniref:(northern house mosquito) hypothetical protein n=1 Tax=Culex pipiens TaxID=7175 RepID=A0A8D8GR77_CULPI